MIRHLSDLGYTRVRAASIPVELGDLEANARKISEAAFRAAEDGVDILVLPELSLTGYTCGDLFFDSLLLQKVCPTLVSLSESLLENGPLLIFGTPFVYNGSLYNCGVVMDHERIYGIVPKQNLPNYNEFYERRWFSVPVQGLKPTEICIPDCNHLTYFGTGLLFQTDNSIIGVEICEDLWIPTPPSCELATGGADIIVNLSATPESIGKHRYLNDLISQQSARCRSGYVYASAGSGESSTDLVFSGNAIVAEDGAILAEGNRFSLEGTEATADIDTSRLRSDRLRFKTFNEGNSQKGEDQLIINCVSKKSIPSKKLTLLRPVSRMPFVPLDSSQRFETCREIIDMQAWGLVQRLRKIGCRKAVIGISGGLDSTLALLVTHKTFELSGLDPKGIIAVTMPGFGTTDRTHSNAWDLMVELGVTPIEIPISGAVNVHFEDIGQDPEKHDATYENSQARERTQILMDLANKENGIVIGTGDLSELALGWCTYNGDHMSMYAVNTSIPKTLVSYLVETFAIMAEKDGNLKTATTLRDIIATPISPELIPANSDGTIAQKTEDLVGPYELHDFFLYHLLRNRFSPEKILFLAKKAWGDKYDTRTIFKWLRIFYRRFFNQQFKRSCLPDGPKVGSVCLSPRGDWRMPSDVSSAMWLSELERLETGFSERESSDEKKNNPTD